MQDADFHERRIEPRFALGSRALLEAPPDFIDLLPVAAYACDEAGRILWFNRRAAELWGREPRIGGDSELFCGSWKLYFGGRQITRDETPMAIALRTGQPIHGEEGVLERPDGSRIWVTVHIDPVIDATGKVLGAVNCFHDTTELHRARTEAAERDARARQLLDALPAAIYTTDTAGRITYYNRAAVALAGREPVIGSDEWCVTRKLYWPDGTPLPHDECPMALALKEKRANSGMEAVAERPDGTRVPFIPYPTPLFDASGALTGAVNMLVDISERKRAEQSLVENEQHLAAELAATRQLQRISTELFGEQDVQSIHAKLLDAAAAIMGSDFASIQVLHPERGEHGELHLLGHRGFTPETAKFWEWVTLDSASTCGAALRTGERVVVADITRCEFMDGTEDLKAHQETGIRAVQTTPLVSRSGRLLGMISTHWREPHEPSDSALQRLDVLARQAADLLERAENEAALRRAEAESQRQRRLYEAILTNTPDLAYIFSLDHRFTYANEVLLRMWGKTREEAIGKNCLELGYEPWHAAMHDREIEQVVATRRPVRGEVPFTGTFGRRIYDYIFVPVIGPDGAVEAVAGTTRDVTEQRQAAQRALAQKQILEMVATGQPLLETLDALTRFLEAQVAGMRCGILIVADDGAHFRRGSGPSLPEHYHEALDGAPITPPYLGSCGEAVHRGEAIACPDVEAETRYAGSWRTLLLSCGIRAARSTPVCSSRGRPMASIAMYFDAPRDPTPDPELLDIATHLAAIALEHHRASKAVRDSEERFRAYVSASSDVVYRMSPNWREMRHLEGHKFIADTLEPSSGWLDKYIHPDDQRKVMGAIRKTIRSKSIFELEHRVLRSDGTLGWMYSRAVPLLDPEGEIVEWIGAAKDVTERKRHEQHREMLLNELNHRVKNTLATVQSMAVQTLRNSPDAAQARDQIEARLMALSKAHEILTREQWNGAHLRNIVEEALAPYCAGRERFDIEGPDIWLTPRYALSLAMALHELCTNALKYGALSSEAGRVRIEWQITGDPEGAQALQMRWIERDGPPVEPPSARGFGSRLIERGLRQDLHGDVKLEFARSGVVCTITAPLPTGASRAERTEAPANG